MQASLPPGPYVPADLMVFEVSVAERDDVWTTWQVPIGESVHNLRVWSKALPFSEDNYSPFEKQLLGLLMGLSKH